MDIGFGGGEKACSDARLIRTSGKHRRERPCRCDPARGEHRDVDGVQHGVKERKQRRGPAQVTARLHALSDDQVAPCVLGSPRLVR